MQDFRIDSHKLIFHVQRVNDWLKSKTIYPIYLELSPAGSCNHRCIYCGLDFMKYRPIFLDSAMLKKRLLEMGRLGVKSIMYAGEGEPFLHKDIASIIKYTKRAGIDVAVTTNGVLFNSKLAQDVLPYLTWIKVSINGGTKETYAKIHRADPKDFDKVIENMSYAAKFKKSNGLKCTLGMQIILLHDNYKEIKLLAKIAKKIGMDYLVVKPYSQHPQSITNRFKDTRYEDFLYLAKDVKKVSSPGFNVIFRDNAMRKWDAGERSYKHCLALPFWAYIDSSGDVWACSIYLSKEKFRIGNIYKSSFEQIWLSAKRKRLQRWAAKKLDTSKCRVNCRMDEINRYLWEITHPSQHVNFI